MRASKIGLGIVFGLSAAGFILRFFSLSRQMQIFALQAVAVMMFIFFISIRFNAYRNKKIIAPVEERLWEIGTFLSIFIVLISLMFLR